MTATRYITTPIYYASGKPHLGHAYTSIVADCFKRYFALKGETARLLTGTDEHGMKIETRAEAAGLSPQAFVDQLAEGFKSCADQLEISYDDFIRTTEERHKKIAAECWEKMNENGDIYLDFYEGLYCVDCEQYYVEGDLLDGKCPIHETVPKTLKEESYFLKLSRYQDQLLAHIEANPEFIVPKTRRNEVVSFLKDHPLQDLSISRTSFQWGIKVPGDDKHVMYVWVDALVNYMSALGGIKTDLFNQYWPHTIHIIGKDILRFHAIYWPVMLLSLGVDLPQHLVVHGWWTVKNKKISKSDPATQVDPIQLAEDIGPDGLKYYLLRTLTLGQDGDMDYEDMITVLNAGLANNIGNLVNRLVSMGEKYLDSSVTLPEEVSLSGENKHLSEGARDMATKVEEQMGRFMPSAAIQAIMEYGTMLNTYLEQTAPWQLAKDPNHIGQINEIFGVVAEGLRWIGNLISPFTPQISQQIKAAIGDNKAPYWPENFEVQSRQLVKGGVIFKRIQKDEQEKLIAKWTGQ